MKNSPFISFAPVFLFAVLTAVIKIPVFKTFSEPITIVIVLLAAVFILVKALVETPYYPVPTHFRCIYGTAGSKSVLAGSLAIGVVLMLVMLASVVFNAMALRDGRVSGLSAAPDFILVVVKILAAVSFMVILSQSNYGETEQMSSTRAAAFLLIVYACYSLILIYRRNAANPAVYEFAWQVLAMSSFAFMWIYMLGLTAKKQYRSIRHLRFFIRMTVVLSAAAAVHNSDGAILNELLFCFICASVTDILLSRNIAINADTQRRLLDHEI